MHFISVLPLKAIWKHVSHAGVSTSSQCFMVINNFYLLNVRPSRSLPNVDAQQRFTFAVVLGGTAELFLVPFKLLTFILSVLLSGFACAQSQHIIFSF